MLRAATFAPEDMLLLEPQAAQLLDIPRAERLEFGARLQAGGSAFTLWDDIDGRPVPIACCGAHYLHADYAQLWALFSRHKPRVPLRLTRIVKRYVASLSQRRVDTQVAAANAGACGWAELIGFELEATLCGAMPDGGDMAIFVRRSAAIERTI